MFNINEKEIVKKQLEESAQVKMRAAETLIDVIVEASRLISGTYRNNGQVLLIGNGGSAADAQHIAAEFIGRFKKDRRPLPAMALTTNTSVITALGNDFGYDSVFTRGVEAFGKPGDILIAITTSGNSPNVIAAIAAAKKNGLKVIGFTGRDGGKIKSLADVAIIVPSQDTQRIQEAHITIGHIVCDLVEQSLFG